MEPEQADRNCATFLGQGQRRSPSSSHARPKALWSLPLLPAEVPGEPACAARMRPIQVCSTPE